MFQYAPKRIHSMMRSGLLQRSEVKAAATFAYFEYHQWLLFSGMQSNFPKGYKVQTSVRNHGMRGGMSQAKPVKWDYDILKWALIEEVSFKDIAYRCLAKRQGKSIRGAKGIANRTAHRKGIELFRQSLARFAAALAS